MRAAAWVLGILGIAIWFFGASFGLKVPLNAALGIPIAIAGAVMEVVARKRKA
jgi:hypothetical protein